MLLGVDFHRLYLIYPEYVFPYFTISAYRNLVLAELLVVPRIRKVSVKRKLSALRFFILFSLWFDVILSTEVVS